MSNFAENLGVLVSVVSKTETTLIFLYYENQDPTKPKKATNRQCLGSYLTANNSVIAAPFSFFSFHSILHVTLREDETI